MEAREFDLNIEKVLENWSVAHAVREIIANALDEQILTDTQEIKIYKDEENNWHIRDYGRGLKYIHLTQNENEEKLSHPRLIGKFGVGLKDALATFDRHKIGVVIDSKHGHITIGQSTKHGFSDITTLHAYINEPINENFTGTDFCLSGCTDNDIKDAKNFFLQFANLKLYERTEYGEVYGIRNGRAEIFINGIKVAEEDNFLFSYNITSLNSTLKKALNRERTNVGRTAYSDRVRTILLNVKSDEVIEAFTDNLSQMSNGTQCDEMKWVDVQTYAVKLLNARKETVFVTPKEIEETSGAVLEVVYKSGKKPIFIPDTVKKKIENESDVNGNVISTIITVVEEYNESFEYVFIPYEGLTQEERKVYDLVSPTIKLFESKMTPEQIFISEKLQPDMQSESLGVYERNEDRIIILRSQLASVEEFLGTLIHELTHADSGWPDICRPFETELTNRIGLLASKIIGCK